jgi:hypothetical protein
VDKHRDGEAQSTSLALRRSYARALHGGEVKRLCKEEFKALEPDFERMYEVYGRR